MSFSIVAAEALSDIVQPRQLGALSKMKEERSRSLSRASSKQRLQSKGSGGLTREFAQSLVRYATAPHLERCCLFVVALRTNPADLEEFRPAFYAFDADCDGKISLDELGQACHRHRLPISADTLFSAIDLHGSGSIGFEEFVAACLHVRLAPLDRWLAEQTFRSLDVDKEFQLHAKDVQRLLGALPAGLPYDRPFRLEEWVDSVLGLTPPQTQTSTNQITAGITAGISKARDHSRDFVTHVSLGIFSSPFRLEEHAVPQPRTSCRRESFADVKTRGSRTSSNVSTFDLNLEQPEATLLWGGARTSHSAASRCNSDSSDGHLSTGSSFSTTASSYSGSSLRASSGALSGRCHDGQGCRTVLPPPPPTVEDCRLPPPPPRPPRYPARLVL